MLQYKPFLEQLATFIDGHLASVYQILDSRLVPECDDDILRIAINFAKNSCQPTESLLLAIGDLSGIYDQLIPHSQDILELIDEVLHLCTPAFEGTVQLDEDSAHKAKTSAGNIWQLSKTMMVEAAKTASDSDGVDQIAVNSGALACQLCLQSLPLYLASQSAAVENLLMEVVKLSELLTIASDSYLYSRLYGIFCSGFIYLPDITIGYLEKQKLLEAFLKTLSAKSNAFLTGYDRKLFILSMISIFKSKLRQEALDAIAIGCLDASVLNLHVQRMEEDLKLSNQQKSLGKDGKSLNPKPATSDAERQDIAVYNMIKGKSYSLSQVLQEEADSKDESEEILEFLMGSDRDAKKSIVNIKSKIIQVDEFREFIVMFNELKSFLGDKLNELILEKISSAARLVLPGILQCQKITTVIDEKQHDVDAIPRKIVKVKARPPVQPQ